MTLPDAAAAESEHDFRVPGTERFGGAGEGRAGDMAVVEGEHNFRVPGTERFG
jgi:hypothetical protein